jgi:hypothetical protein
MAHFGAGITCDQGLLLCYRESCDERSPLFYRHLPGFPSGRRDRCNLQVEIYIVIRYT